MAFLIGHEKRAIGVEAHPVGGAETVLGITDAFKPLENSRGIYVKPTCTTISAPTAAPAIAKPAVPATIAKA